MGHICTRWMVSLTAACALLLPFAVLAQEPDRLSQQVIVKWRAPLSIAGRSSAAVQALREAEARTGFAAQFLRTLATGAEVLRLATPASQASLSEFVGALQGSPVVEYVEEDVRLMPAQVPNDPRYTEQWHYFEPAAGINLEPAWGLASGAGVTIAVIDTGFRPHVDLAANIVAGFDFISDVGTARDGDERDADAQDPGDWNDDPLLCIASSSSWHGTHVAGTLAALTNNGNAVAGIAFNARVVPIRVLGRCGGLLSDVAEGIMWAAGGTVTGVPDNLNPARVLNLSLGGPGICSSTMQEAVNFARTAGAVIVVAAGNTNTDAGTRQPASCAGVMTVAAVNRGGAKAFYSNFGAVVDIAAPGGDISNDVRNGVLSTLNFGLTVPAADREAFYAGTSMATPHVAGVAALILSRSPLLSVAEVETLLLTSARAFPAACNGCGAGIVDAFTAVARSVTPAAPATMSVTEKPISSSYTVYWSSSVGATSYTLERRNYGGPWGGAQTVTDTQKAFVSQPSGEYEHRVKACNSRGCSDWTVGAFIRICNPACF